MVDIATLMEDPGIGLAEATLRYRNALARARDERRRWSPHQLRAALAADLMAIGVGPIEVRNRLLDASTRWTASSVRL